MQNIAVARLGRSSADRRRWWVAGRSSAAAAGLGDGPDDSRKSSRPGFPHNVVTMPPKKCGYCRQPGHRKNKCPLYIAKKGIQKPTCRICGQPGHNRGTCPQRDPSTVTGRRAGRPRVAAVVKARQRRLTRQLNPHYDASGNRIVATGSGAAGFAPQCAAQDPDPSLVGYQFQARDTARLQVSGRRGTFTIRTHSGFEVAPVERRVRSSAKALQRAAEFAQRHEERTTGFLDKSAAEFRANKLPEPTILPTPSPRLPATPRAGQAGLLRIKSRSGREQRPKPQPVPQPRQQHPSAAVWDPRAADTRSQAVRQDLQDTRRRMEMEAAFEAGRRGREMLEAAKREAACKDLEHRRREAAADDLVRRLDAHRVNRTKPGFTPVPKKKKHEPRERDLVDDEPPVQDARHSGTPAPVQARVRARKRPVEVKKPDDSRIAPAQPVVPNDQHLRDAVEGRPTQHAEPLPGGLPPRNRIVFDTLAGRYVRTSKISAYVRRQSRKWRQTLDTLGRTARY